MIAGGKNKQFKYEQALDSLRRYASTKCLKPGARFCSFEQLEKRFPYRRTVLQKAVAQLKSDGYVVARGRRGLYVAEHPPHLARFGVIFPDSPSDRGWSLLASTVVMQAQRLEPEQPGLELPLYYDVRAGSDGLRILQEDLAARRLGGIMPFWVEPELLEQDGVDASDLPRLSLFPRKWQVCPGQVVTTDGGSFWRLAGDWLRERGRRRVAVITLAEALGYARENAAESLPLPGPHWVQSVDRHYPESGYQLVGLLMDYPQRGRPDGLVIADDNLVEPVLAGLVRHGIRIGRDLDVAAHCNWPLLTPGAMPVYRIGCDIHVLMEDAVEFLRAARCRRDFDTSRFYLRFRSEQEA